jgi:hypothetical protein
MSKRRFRVARPAFALACERGHRPA